MNPRILKKLCKRIIYMGHPIAKDVWIHEEPVGDFYIGSKLWGDRKINATGYQKRSHYMTKSSVSHCYVIGVGADYWGEAIDPEAVYWVAVERVLWTIGKPRIEKVLDSAGEVIDEIEGFPETSKRLTGAFVIKFLRNELKRTGGRS